MYLLAGGKFKCNFDENIAKYCRTFNGIMGKVGRSASQEVIIELVRMTVLPIILYGTEACPLGKKRHFIIGTHCKLYIWQNIYF